MTAFIPPVLSFLLILHLSWIPQSLQNQTFPALFVLGDSTCDAGANNHLATIFKSNFPPYGRDFYGRIPTGRFCNGKLVGDFIVSSLGIKEVLPSYVDPNLNIEDLLTGVTFCSGGTGYDDLTAKINHVVPVWKQLEWLRECIERIMMEVGEERAHTLISQSLFAISLGSNDIGITYTIARRLKYDFPAYARFLVQKASEVIREMYRLGARKMGVAGVPPVGCVPAVRTLAGVVRECVESKNAMSMLFNNLLSAEINLLAVELQGSRIVYLNIYDMLLQIILYHRNYGFEEERFACCGTGTLEAGVLCNSLNAFTCSDSSKYVFWDSVHPAEKTYEIIADRVLRDYIPMM